MEKLCVGCNTPIHPKRLEILPKTKTCVECSNSEKKAGVSVMKGSGDHTYVETVIMEASEYRKYMELENKILQINYEENKDENNDDDIEANNEIVRGFHEIDLSGEEDYA